jgi:hypothetical protein
MARMESQVVSAKLVEMMELYRAKTTEREVVGYRSFARSPQSVEQVADFVVDLLLI